MLFTIGLACLSLGILGWVIPACNGFRLFYDPSWGMMINRDRVYSAIIVLFIIAGATLLFLADYTPPSPSS